MKQISVWVTLGIWAFSSLDRILFALWKGYGGRAFATAATILSLLLLSMLLFAARGVTDSFRDTCGSGSGLFVSVFLFLLYVVYLFGTGTFALPRIALMAAFIFLPFALTLSQEMSAPGSWQDFLTIASVWAFVKFGPSHYLWPYPDNRLAYVFTVLFSVNIAIAVFLLARRTKGVGYAIGWGKGWTRSVLGSFLLFGCIAIPVGMSVHFISFTPQWPTAAVVGRSIGILIFTAWPEELLFRRVTAKSPRPLVQKRIGWLVDLLGPLRALPHHQWALPQLAIRSPRDDRWPVYAWTWRKTNSIFASATVHAAVDITWHVLFRAG